MLQLYNTLFDVHKVIFRFGSTPVAGTPYYFDSDGYIDTRITRGVQIVTTGEEIPTTLPLGAGTSLTALTTAQIKNTFITLASVKKNNEPDLFWNRMPLYNLNRINNSSMLPELRKRISIKKSYLEFSDVTGITTSTFILFYFHLEKPTN